MLDASVTAVLALVGLNLGTVPKKNLVVSVEGEKQVLELMVLQVPDGLLLLVWIRPDGHAVILTFLRAAILSHV